MSQYGYGGQMQMPGYNAHPQQPMQQPMTQDTRDYVNKMRQQLDAFEQRFSQPPMPQQPMQQPVIQQPHPMQQEPNQLAMLVVASIDEAQNHPPDLTGKVQWFVDKETGLPYSKQFNVKTAGLIFLQYGVVNPETEETPPQATESKSDPQPKQNELDALRAEIAALNDKYEKLEGKVNAKSDVVQHDGRKQPAADDTKHDEPPTAEPDTGAVSGDNADGKRGTKPPANNRKSNAEQPKPDANPTRPDSK